MKAALEGTEEAPMIRPAGLVDRLIDKQTGASARPGQPNTMFELFIADNSPLYGGEGLLPSDNTGSSTSSGSAPSATPVPLPPRSTRPAAVEDTLSTEIIF